MAIDTTEALKSLNDRIESARTDVKAAAEKLQEALKGFAEKAEANGKNLREELTKAGEKLRSQSLTDTAKSAADSATATAKDLSTRAVTALGLASNDDLNALNKKLDSLTRKIRKLEKASA